jgi:hypothetical protein
MVEPTHTIASDEELQEMIAEKSSFSYRFSGRFFSSGTHLPCLSSLIFLF